MKKIITTVAALLLMGSVSFAQDAPKKATKPAPKKTEAAAATKPAPKKMEASKPAASKGTTKPAATKGGDSKMDTKKK